MSDEHVEPVKTQCLFSYNTEMCADTVDSLKISDTEQFIACGTYEVQQITDDVNACSAENNVRIGSIILFSFDDQNSCHVATQLNCGDVLDLKWRQDCTDRKQQPLMASVHSNSKVVLREVLSSNDSPTISSLASHDTDSGVLLSVDWQHTTPSQSLATCSSDGSIHVTRMRESDLVLEAEHKHAHEFDVWAIGWDTWDTNLLYSGGDDWKLKLWDLRSSLNDPIYTNRAFEMGVCCVHSSPFREHQLAIGSYDEHVTLWDRRKLKQPISRLHVGGGVWRVRWHPHNPQRLLVAGMHSGFHVIKVLEDTSSVMTSFTEHESLAYGVDWLPSKDRQLVASCSFYDRCFKIWEYSEQE